MPLDYHDLDRTAYEQLRFQLLANAEENGNAKYDPYPDGSGYPTIGYGFNLGAIIEQLEPDFLHRIDLADLEVELRDGQLILRTVEKDYAGAEQKVLMIENWETWDKDNSHIRLENGSRVNLQALIVAYGISDGGGPVDLGEAAALRFADVDGIEAPQVGQAIGGTGAFVDDSGWLTMLPQAA